MFVVEATQVIEATAEDVLAFVMDLERYKVADRKIGKIRRIEHDGDEVRATMWARFGPFPTPVTQKMRLEPGSRIDVTNAPSWQDRLVDFHGEFVCEASGNPAGSSTQVTHRYRFTFRGPGRLVEPLVHRWLRRDIADEVRRMKEILESGLTSR